MGFDYTVGGNDKGLTYIFLEQAKKQAGFDGSKKINWNSVMSVFDEIQQEEAAEGQRLFRGGTDKTRAGWGKSYQIFAGDKIQLSDEQMNRIYSAMGVDLSKSTQQTPQATEQTPPPAQQTPPTNGASQTQPPTQQTPPATDPNPPATDPNPPVADPNPPAADPISSELNIRHTRLAEQSVMQEDGTTFVYDDNGYVHSVLDANGNETKCISRNADGSVHNSHEYEYDANGNVTKYIYRNPDGSVDEYVEYEYDANGNMTKYISRNAGGSVNYYIECEHDANGNETKDISRNPDGSVDYYNEYEYDANGNMTKYISRNADGTIKED